MMVEMVVVSMSSVLGPYLVARTPESHQLTDLLSGNFFLGHYIQLHDKESCQ
jgi:hypothetical protein